MNTTDSIGAVGVGIILLAYFFNIFSWIKKDGILFYLMNIVGASIACFTSYIIHYIPFVILEATWAIVSVIGLLKRKKTSSITGFLFFITKFLLAYPKLNTSYLPVLYQMLFEMFPNSTKAHTL